MALKKPLVLYGATIGQIQAGDVLDPTYTPASFVWTNGESSSAAAIGAPVYLSGSDAYKLARADAGATTQVVGLAASASTAAGAQGTVQTSGALVATTGQWDAVTGGSGGLTAAALYYLDPATSGKLTATAPSTAGQYIAPVGRAADATTLVIRVSTVVQL